MPPEIVAAIIAAVVSAIGSAVTLLVGMQQIRIERRKIKAEYQRLEKELQIEKDRLQLELRSSVGQARLTQAEVTKLRVETDKLSVESDEIRRRRLEEERNEIRNLLMFFERAFFEVALPCEEPLAMYRAIRQTRISLQTAGASLIRNSEVAEHFVKARSVLREVEYEVEKRYPIIVELADELADEPNTFERQRHLQEKMGDEFREVARIMIDCRGKIDDHLGEVRKYLRELDTQINVTRSTT